MEQSRTSPAAAARQDAAHAVAFAQEGAGARDYEVAFVEPFLDLGIAARKQTHAHPARLHAVVAHDLDDGAFGAVEHGGKRNGGAAALAYLDDGARIGTDLVLVVVADR